MACSFQNSCCLWAGSSSPELWQLLPSPSPCSSLPLLHTEPSASLRVRLCHLADTSWVDLPFHRSWSRQNCWTQYTPKRPALWQVRVLYAVQFYYLNRYPIITPPMGSDPVSPKHPIHQPQVHSLAQMWVLTLGRFLTCVHWGEQNLPSAPSFARGCGWRLECLTQARSITDLPVVEGYNYDFCIFFVIITKLFSPEMLLNRHIIHACSGLPVGLSRSIRASNAPDPFGLGPCGDFREEMLFFLSL